MMFLNQVRSDSMIQYFYKQKSLLSGHRDIGRFKDVSWTSISGIRVYYVSKTSFRKIKHLEDSKKPVSEVSKTSRRRPIDVSCSYPHWANDSIEEIK